MDTKYGCEVVVDLSKLEYLQDFSFGETSYYKSDNRFIIVIHNQISGTVDIFSSYSSDGENYQHLIRDIKNDTGVYSGELGKRRPQRD